MQKIKIIDNGFELPYVDEEDTDYSRERIIVNKIIDLIEDYTCFVVTKCNEEVLSKFKILKYAKQGKYTNKAEIDKFPGIEDYMFEEVYFYFMPKDFDFNQFISMNYDNKIFTKYGAKLFVGLNDCGFVFIRYNSMYDEQIRNIIGEENIKQPFFKRKCKKKFRN